MRVLVRPVWSSVGNLLGVNKQPAILFLLRWWTLCKNLSYSQAGFTRVSATPSKTYWRTKWKAGMEETVRTLPERGCSTGGNCFLCISKQPATITDSAPERFPATAGKDTKEKSKTKEELDISVVGHNTWYTQGCFLNVLGGAWGAQMHTHCVFWPQHVLSLFPVAPHWLSDLHPVI